MRLRTRIGLGTTAAALLVAALGTVALAAGNAETLVAFDPEAGQLSEGVAVAPNGDVYASLAPLGQLVRIAADSDGPELVGRVEGLVEGDFGLLGLAVGSDGAVYGAVGSSVPGLRGVWRFDVETGDAERVAGTDAIGLPNDLAFDDAGTMYISDSTYKCWAPCISSAAAVWRVPAAGSAEPWVADLILTGTGEAGLGFPIGANGIEVHDGAVYVGNTERSQLVRVPIDPDGSAGEPALFAQMPSPVDGIDVDDEGNVYAALPFANLVTVTSQAGETSTLATVEMGLDAPTSVALGPDGKAYVANNSIALGGPLGAGPGIVVVEVE